MAGQRWKGSDEPDRTGSSWCRAAGLPPLPTLAPPAAVRPPPRPQAVRRDLKRHYAAAALGMGAFFAEDLVMESGWGGLVHAGARVWGQPPRWAWAPFSLRPGAPQVCLFGRGVPGHAAAGY